MLVYLYADIETNFYILLSDYFMVGVEENSQKGTANLLILNWKK